MLTLLNPTISIREKDGTLVPIGEVTSIEGPAPDRRPATLHTSGTIEFLIEEKQFRRLVVMARRTPRYLALRQQLKRKGRPGWRKAR